jgi:hypothetical protein
MDLDPEASAALDRFLANDTWYAPHTADWNRWYEFIDAYSRRNSDLVESDLRHEIETRLVARGGHLNEYVEPVIAERVHVAVRVLEFLRHTRR